MIEKITGEIKEQLTNLFTCDLYNADEFLFALLDLGEKIDRLVEEYDYTENSDIAKRDAEELSDVILSYYSLMDTVSPLFENENEN